MSASCLNKKRFIDKYSYLVSNILGQGYSGSVHLGKNEETGKTCAIKIIEKSILKYQVHKSMILCQIEFLTLLKGAQNILTLYEVFNTKNNLYFVLELCNTDLQEYINVKETILEVEAIDILKNIIAGYKSIWKHDIVHRDLKPSNILLQGEQIKIADFGFSMFRKDSKEFQKINVGSPYYMPLEVLTSNQYSFQSDIWALGIIYYQMLVGKVPWKAKHQKQLCQQIKELKLSSIIPKNISENSQQFLSKVLQIDPRKRMTPQELINYKFQQKESDSYDLRASCRSYEAQNLLKSTKLQKIQGIPNLSRIRADEDQNEPFQSQQMNPDIDEYKKNDLGESRMKKQRLEQNMDEVNDLPISPIKKKTIQDRKTSLQIRCQVIEINQLNQIEIQSYPDKLPCNPQSKSSNTNAGKSFQSNKVTTQTLNSIPDTIKNKSSMRKIKSQIERNAEENNQKIKQTNSSKNISKKENLIQKVKANRQDKEKKQNPSKINQKAETIMTQFSKTLRSQIHFCRFIFKLLMKIVSQIPSQSNLVKIQFKEQMAAFVFMRLEEIENRQMSDEELRENWLHTQEWFKIKTVIKQYKTKYSLSLKKIKMPSCFDYGIYKKLLRKAILNLYERAHEAYLEEEQKQNGELGQKDKNIECEKVKMGSGQEQSMLMRRKQEILILDSLITLKQLHKLEEKLGWQQFEQKSKIQAIVEGQPLRYIQKKHIIEISEKLQKLKLL